MNLCGRGFSGYIQNEFYSSGLKIIGIGITLNVVNKKKSGW